MLKAIVEMHSESLLRSNKARNKSADDSVIEIDATCPISKSNGFLTKNASEIVAIARETFNSGKTRPISFRKEQLKNLKRLVQENMSEFEDALLKDLGRHPIETIMLELNVCIHELKGIIWHLDEWLTPKYPSKPSMNILDKLYIISDPYGVVLIIGAWNFPLTLLFGPAAGAIAAGNCMVMKPSEVASASEKLIARLVPMYLDKDCYHIYTGGAKETAELLELKFDYIFFTGSPHIGKLIHAAANKYLTPVTLELGGKNPLYIDDTVDMKKTVKRILFGKCSNAGQVCIAPDYLLCTHEVQNKFVECAKIVLEEWYSGNADLSPDYCKIVSDRHWNRLKSLIEDRNDIALGGRVNQNSCFIEPTILTDVALVDVIMKEEIFGPILPIVIIKNINEAIKIINDRDKPLVLYIFSNNKNSMNVLLNQCSSGGVLINDTLTHFIVDTLPFGGVGLSGMGNYHGKQSFDTFSHKKSVLEKDYSLLSEYGMTFRYPPYSYDKFKVLNMLTTPIRLPSSATINTIITFASGMICVVIVGALYHLINNDV